MGFEGISPLFGKLNCFIVNRVGQTSEFGKGKLFGAFYRIDIQAAYFIGIQHFFEAIAQGLATLREGLGDHPAEQGEIVDLNWGAGVGNQPDNG